jgi:hypothetical protein
MVPPVAGDTIVGCGGESPLEVLAFGSGAVPSVPVGAPDDVWPPVDDVVEPTTTLIVPVPLPEDVVEVVSVALPVGGVVVAAVPVAVVVVVAGGVAVVVPVGGVVTGVVGVPPVEPPAVGSPDVVVVTAGGVTVWFAGGVIAAVSAGGVTDVFVGGFAVVLVVVEVWLPVEVVDVCEGD